MESKICALIGCLLLLCTIEGSYFVSSVQGGRSIDDIINESWERLVASGKYNVNNQLQSKNDKRLFSHLDHHHAECESDKFMKKFEHLKSFTVTDSTPQLPPSTHLSNHKRTTQTMRFYVDDTVMSSGSDPQACYNDSYTIYIPTPNYPFSTPHQCTLDDVLSAGLLDLIQNSIIPTMLQIFSEVLSVKNTQTMEPLKLDSEIWARFGFECDTDVPIPSSYVTTGFTNTDYILFVTARPTLSTNTVAYAGGCKLAHSMITDLTLGNFQELGSNRYSRPYAGILNLNPRWFQSYVTSMSLFEYKTALKIAMHEVRNFYSPSIWFQDVSSGVAPSGQSYNKTIQKLRSPNVLRFARDYFNCTSLDGVELEEYGGTGTAGSHWERRVCGEEYMTGFVSDQMWMSGFTFSLFDDMGWYDVDRSKVEYIGWGKDQGCGFVQSRCESSWPSADPGYWCTGAVNGCTGDRVGVGSCQLTTASKEAYYQHFVNELLGGVDAAADWCPYTYPWTSCRDTGQTPQTDYFEVYGDTSRCWEVQDGAASSLVCYPFQCTNDTFNNTILQVQINSTWVTCPTAGGNVSISSILGGSSTVNCPKTSLFCRIVDGYQPQVLITDTLLLSTPSRSPSASPSRTPSNTPSTSVTPSVTPTSSITPSVTTTPTRTPDPSSSPSPSPTSTPSITPSPSSSPLIQSSASPELGTTGRPDSSSGGFTLHSAAFVATVVVVAAGVTLAIGGVIAWGIRRNRQRSPDDIDMPTLWKALE